MIKRDRIFYIGCGLLAVGLILLFLDSAPSYLFLVGAYLLRPTLYALGMGKRFADERQIQISSRSGNVGFLVVMLGATLLAVSRTAQGETVDELNMLIILGLTTKAVIGLLMIGDLRKAGVIILISWGVIMGMFLGGQGVDHIRAGETPWETFAGIGLIAVSIILGLLARKFPRPVALVLLAGAAAVFWFLHLYDFRDPAIGLWIFVVLPFVGIAACLWRRPDSDSFPVTE